MTDQDTEDTPKFSYIVVHEHEVSFYEGYAEIRVPDKDVLRLTAYEAAALKDYLWNRFGNKRSLVMIEPAESFDITKITANYTAKLEKLEKQRVAEQNKWNEAEKKKVEKRKLKQLEKLKKELAELSQSQT